MTKAQIEEQLKQWSVVVHDTKAFTPNCLCKFTWEGKHGVDSWLFINDAKSVEDLIRIVTMQMSVHNIEQSREADLIINYK